MQNHKILTIAIFFLFVFILSPQISFAQNTKDGKETKDSQKAKDEAEFPDYKKYLKDESLLSYGPEAHLFEQLINILKNQFYGNVTEENMVISVQKEIERLYKTAEKVNPMQGHKFSSPKEIYDFIVKTDTELPKNLVIYASVCGLLKTTGDPYTAYLTPKEFKQMMESLQSAAFGGIGIFLELDREHDNMLTVIEPIEDTPAFNSGLKSGDIIVEINGEKTKGLDLDLLSSKLRGPKGSQVVLTIKRKGINGTRKYTIVRDTISVKSVSSREIEPGIGYIKLRTFGERTGREFEEALQALTSKGVKSLVIDLRNNGGGYVNSAIKISAMFLGKEDIIVSVKNKSGRENTQLSKNENPNEMPIVVLVNKYSASASEITAGAFKDHKRAMLVGANTFGKGSVQQVVPMRDGSAMKITVAHYCTPNGSDIDKKGLEPDYKVEMDADKMGTENDTQMKKAIELLKNRIGLSTSI